MIETSALSTGRSALIGHTGLVGSNLTQQFRFDDCFNSSSIAGIDGRSYDLLVCSGARGTKWIANRDPAADIAGIEGLLGHLQRVRAANVILISTVDVYGVPVGVDEESPVDGATQTSYGRHRHYLEQALRERFQRMLIVRLPALFGPGLRKNALFDLVWNHEVDKIHPASVYQFYDLQHTWADITLAASAGLTVSNFATEPIPIRDVAREIFGVELTSPPGAGTPPAAYDFRTKYDYVFGGAHGYLRSRATVMDEIGRFVEWFRRTGREPGKLQT